MAGKQRLVFQPGLEMVVTGQAISDQLKSDLDLRLKVPVSKASSTVIGVGEAAGSEIVNGPAYYRPALLGLEGDRVD